MNLAPLILDYHAVPAMTKRKGWRRRLVTTGKMLAEFVILALLALAVVWLGRALVASH